MLTNLSVNLNKIALLRNAREGNTPSVTLFAAIALKSGAAGITVHPRPDERHIRADDVPALAKLLKAWPGREFNIEGNPFLNLMDHVRAVKPDQVTFVPDSDAQKTSDHGFDLTQDGERLRPLIAEAKSLGCRVSLFMDPVPEQMALAKVLGADRWNFSRQTMPPAAVYRHLRKRWKIPTGRADGPQCRTWGECRTRPEPNEPVGPFGFLRVHQRGVHRTRSDGRGTRIRYDGNHRTL